MGGRGRRFGRRETTARLDPIRWRRPGRVALIRLVAVAALLAVALFLSWSPPLGCGPPGAARPSPDPASGAARPPSDIATGTPATPRARGGTTGSPVPQGSVGVPVRLAEPAALTLLHAGDRVDLLRVDATGATTSVAAAALVLGVTDADDPASGGLLLALRPAEAKKAVATPDHGFAVLLRPD